MLIGNNKNLFFVCFQQLDATQKALIPVQNSIIQTVKLIAKIEHGAMRTEAEAVLTEMRKADETMRDRLYILQVWRKFDFETADKLARRKAGEFLDPDLSILLEQREKRMEREKRERAKEGSSNAKRFRGGASQYGESF